MSRWKAKVRRGFTLLELLVGIAIIGILTILAMASIQATREAARRIGCSNNLRQVGLALVNHQTHHGMFPPRSPSPLGTAGSSYSRQGISWHVFILPHLERGDLWNQIAKAYEADPDAMTTAHDQTRRVVVPEYVCPSDARLSQSHNAGDGPSTAYSSYMGMTGHIHAPNSGLFARRQGTHPSDIRDGLSNTIAVGERPPPRSMSLGWWYTTHNYGKPVTYHDFELHADNVTTPGDGPCRSPLRNFPGYPGIQAHVFASGSIDNDCDKYHYWSLHPRGANFLFIDGSVRFLTYGMKFHLRDLATIAGGESVEAE